MCFSIEKLFERQNLPDCYGLHDLYRKFEIAGVSQGSVLVSLIFLLLYCASFPTSSRTNVYSFADDVAITSSHEDPVLASRNVQHHLVLMED